MANITESRQFTKYSGASVIRTLHLLDDFSGEWNFHTLFCTINPEIHIPDLNGHFLIQNVEMH